MRLDEAMAILKAALPELRNLYAVKDLAVFGSVARGEAGPESDIDVLVEFEPGKAGGYFKFFTLQEDLEARLGLKVDLVTPDALRKQMRGRILAEAVHAA
jgi:hypothetical protein